MHTTKEFKITDQINHRLEHTEFVEYRLSCEFAYLDYYDHGDFLYIRMCYTHIDHRNEGRMRALIAALKAKGKKVDPGCFTDMGALYLKRYFE